MTLEALVKEVELRSAKEVRELEAKLDAELKGIEAETREVAAKIRGEAERKSQLEAVRERSRMVASAKLQAKKALFEAREQRTSSGLEEVRKRLAAYAKGPDYPGLLASMVGVGTSVLGSDVKLLARAEDVPLLPAKMRSLVDPSRPLRSMGGLVVEKADGSRALNFSFEELLRLGDDRVREILSR